MPTAPRPPLRSAAALAFACALTWPTTEAAAACARPTRIADLQPTFGLRIDNDALGSDGQDRGYTNGLQLTLRTGNLQGFIEPDCLPPPVRAVDRVVDALYPDGLDQRNVLFGLFHGVYTPADHEATGPIANDRPYAAAFLLGAGYNARRGNSLHSTQLRLGIVGPSAKGEQIQNGLHKVLGANEYRGWQNQLRDELVLQLLHERLHRVEFAGAPWGFESDLIGHWGGSLGNFATHANAGVEWRFGRNLSTDFGTDPLRSEGNNVSHDDAPPQRWAWHFFLSFDGRMVLHNITLDGNTWKDSPGIAKHRWVADFGYGAALMHGAWKVVLSQYVRTREFVGQQHRSVFGSLTLVREL